MPHRIKSLTFRRFESCQVPLPFTWRRKLFHFLATNPVVAKIQYGLKITFMCVTALVTDGHSVAPSC